MATEKPRATAQVINSIINNYGEIELVPILDYKGRCNWTVLEDTEDEKLTKEIKYFLDNN